MEKASRPRWIDEEVAKYFKDLRASRPKLKFVVYAFDGERLQTPALRETPLRTLVAECESEDEAIQRALEFRDRCFIVDIRNLTVAEVWADR